MINPFESQLERLARALTDVGGVRVTCQGEEAWTDGAQIMLPSLPEPMDNQLERMVVGFLDHEMAHVAFSDFDVVAAFVARYPDHKAMLNVVEDALIEKRAMARWPGGRANLDDMFRQIRDRIATLASQRDGFGRFCTAVYLRLSHHEDMLGLDREIEGYGDLLAEFPTVQDTRGSARLAEKLLERWFGKQANTQSGPTAPQDDGKKRSGTTDGDDGVPQDQAGDGKSVDGDPDGEHSNETASAESDRTGKDGQKHSADKTDVQQTDEASASDSKHGGGADAAKHPFDGDGDGVSQPVPHPSQQTGSIIEEVLSEAIWDQASRVDAAETYRVYTRELDRIGVIPAAEPKEIQAMLRDKRDVSRRLRRGLANALRSAEKKWWRDDQVNGQLSPRRLYRLCFDESSLAVFRTRAKIQGRSTAVSTLVDVSGSMTSRKISVTREALRAILEALSDLPVPSEALTFTTGNRIDWPDLMSRTGLNQSEIKRRYTRISNLEIGLIQQFGEPVGVALSRLPSIRGSGLTPLGEAMQIAARRLYARRESRRILLVLTDGKAGCESGAQTAVRHAKEVARRAMKAGLELVGVGILDANLCEIIPNTIVIHEIDELPARLCKLLGRTLTKGMNHVG